MKNSNKESLIELNEIEEVQQYGGGSINDEEELEHEEKLEIIFEAKDKEKEKEQNLNDSLDNSKEDEKSFLKSKKERELEEKEHLFNVLLDIAETLKAGNNLKRSMSEIFIDFNYNEIVSKDKIVDKVGGTFYKYMLFIFEPIIMIIFLIGIFQLKSINDALFNFLKESGIKFYECSFHSNCNITINNNETNIYDLYEYIYSYSMNETINFNLMMVTGLIGNVFLKCVNFKVSSFILCLPGIASIILLLNINYKFEKEGIFDYDIVKLVEFIGIYLLLWVGLGASALLPHQILIDSQLKYKEKLIEQLIDQIDIIKAYENKNKDNYIKIKNGENIESHNNINDKMYIRNSVIPSSNYSMQKGKKIFETKNLDFLMKNNTATDPRIDRKKIMIPLLERKKNNKLDCFFVICLVTIFGYIGKYTLNLLIDSFLKYAYGDSYNKRLFLIYTLFLYSISVVFTIILYWFWQSIILKNEKKKGKKQCGCWQSIILKCKKKKEEEKNEKEEEKKEETKKEEENNNQSKKKEEPKKKFKICQICGYIIYRERKKIKNVKGKNCCKLCCETGQNCCNETFCELLSFCDCFDCCPETKCHCCCCKCCEYNEKDYYEDQEVFCYCYKAHRRSLWWKEFIANNIQKKFFPYMIEYFMMQLTTIGFEKQYEKYKNLHIHLKTYYVVSISTFILFFYLTISFTRIYNFDKHNIIQEEDTDKNRKKKNRKQEIKNKISDKILNGTHGILIFNSIFSLVFSLFYLLQESSEIKYYIFNDNINIVLMPILMNRFYYFTLIYYYTYIKERDYIESKRLECLSGKYLITFYLTIENLIIAIINLIIPEENEKDNFYNYNIAYIIQIAISIIPSLFLIIFILKGFGIITCISSCCSCKKCKNNYNIPQFLFFLCSFLLCLGGLWIKMVSFTEYDYDGINMGDFCNMDDNWCNISCKNNKIIWSCCCCDNKSKCCYFNCCVKNCYSCNACICCRT